MILNDKTILITGASSGIGAELAQHLADKNNRLILVARRANVLEELVRNLKPHPQDHLFFQCDVSDAGQVQDVCEWIINAPITIDVLFLNAGVGGGFDVHDINLETFRKQIEINFFGAVYFVKYFAPEMIKQKSGIIAVNGSLAGYRGVPNAAAYSASKGALMNFIDSLRIDLRKYNIQCTLISPGFVKTPLTDKNDYVMPFMMSVEKATRIIIRGLERGKTEIRFPWLFSSIAKIGRLLPNNFYAYMMQDSRKKKRPA
jgi:short-subunit dehydrogenase